MYVHYYYIIGVLRNATKSKELSRAKFKREGSGDSRICTTSLSLSLSLLSLAFRSICWVSEEKEEGKRSLLSHVLEIVIFELKRAKHFHTTLSLVFTLVSLILLTSYVLPLSFGKKYICMLVRESEHICIYIIYVCEKRRPMRESARYRDPIWVHPIYRHTDHCMSLETTHKRRLIVTIREYVWRRRKNT